jgi:serine protease Do
MFTLGLAVGGVSPWVGQWITDAHGASSGVEIPADQLARVDALSQVFRTVAKEVSPAVVRIETTVESDSTTETSRRMPDLEGLPEEFRDFFEKRFQTPENLPQVSGGSGVIIDAKEGLIVTNHHVIESAKENKEHSRISVKLQDGRLETAEIVGTDPKTDLALIKIKAGGLVELEIGESDAMEVGDWVMAVGAPFGYAQTVTQGIISAKGRNLGIIEGYEHFLQTDAAINPGNSGGPLVNMRGEIVGINTAIATNSLVRGYMGIGFAVPSSTLKEVLPALREGREVVRGYLGAGFKNLADEPGMAEALGLKDNRGLMVDFVYEGTPACKAGIQHDDVVLKVEGEPVREFTELQHQVAVTEPGSTLNLTVWRNNEEITIPVEIEEQPEDFFAWKKDRGACGSGKVPESTMAKTSIDSVGMTVEPATRALAEKYGWDYDEVKGKLIVTEVKQLSEAWSALGVREGDVILEVQRKPVRSVSDLRKALSKESLREGVLIRMNSKIVGPTTRYLEVD